MINKIALLYTTLETQEQAKNLAHLVILNKLAVCANIFPKGVSVYSWEDKIEQNDEYYMLFKTSLDLAEKLEDFITQNHPYDVPCILKFFPEVSKGFIEYMNCDLFDVYSYTKEL